MTPQDVRARLEQALQAAERPLIGYETARNLVWEGSDDTRITLYDRLNDIHAAARAYLDATAPVQITVGSELVAGCLKRFGWLDAECELQNGHPGECGFAVDPTKEGSPVTNELVDGFLRRRRVDLLTTEEAELHMAACHIEALGAHPRLTDAVVAIDKARDALADYVEEQRRMSPTPPPASRG